MRKSLSWAYTKSPDNEEPGERGKKTKGFCISLLFFKKKGNYQLILQLYFDVYFSATKL